MSRTTYKATPKAGLYTRLLVDDGYVDRESNSITSQKQMLTQFAEYHGIEIVETYVDDGWSGTNFERPDFKRMIADIESGKINTVITNVRKVDGEKVQSIEIHYRFIGSLPSDAENNNSN